MIQKNIKTKIRCILDKLQKNGFKTYIVGGAVRDIMLDRTPNDIDLLTHASIEQIESIFSEHQVKKTGRAFPVCMVNDVEVSTGRSEYNAEDFPESDLSGRDFTINAMAYDPDLKTILDPFNGRKDLQDSTVRFTKDPEKRIKEDPVRMIRACRFLAMIEGVFSLSSLEAILKYRDLLDDTVAKERIQQEIVKALDLKKPSLFFRALKKTGLLSKVFPSIDRCYSLEGGPYHDETVFDHCMIVGDALPASKPMLRLAGYLHDAGKFDAAKVEDGNLYFHGHEKFDQEVVNDLNTLRFSVKDIRYIRSLINVHMRPLTDETSPKAARRLLAKLETLGLDYRDFMRMRIADKKGNLAKKPYKISEIKVRLNKLINELKAPSVLKKDHLKITGNDIIQLLGMRPGPEIGRIKNTLFETVLDNPDLNTYDELKKICLSLKIKK